MWTAVANCLLRLGQSAGSEHIHAEALVTLERAVSCGDAEGVATRELAKLLRSLFFVVVFNVDTWCALSINS